MEGEQHFLACLLWILLVSFLWLLEKWVPSLQAWQSPFLVGLKVGPPWAVEKEELVPSSIDFLMMVELPLVEQDLVKMKMFPLVETLEAVLVSWGVQLMLEVALLGA